MSTCSHNKASSVSVVNNNGLRKCRNNRIGCEQLVDHQDVEFSEVIEKILLNISAVFEKDELLDEFDIISEESQSNHSPVFHVERKLALESWCVPFLYQHSLQHFITTIIIPNNEKLRAKKNGSATSNAFMFSNGHARSLVTPLSTPNLSNNDDLIRNLNPTCKSCSKQMNNYSSQPKPLPPQLTEIERTKRGHELSRILLLINPDLTTVWNFRRELFQNKREYYEIQVASELNLISLICSRKPKVLEAFNYRKWIVQEQLTLDITDGRNNEDSFIWVNPVEFFQNEMLFVEQAASKYFSNYHAWTYRLYLLTTFANISSRLTTLQQKQTILELELNSANRWLQSHVSDHSGFHYRQQLLLEIRNHHQYKNNSNAIVKLYTDELKENCRMISFYTGHESLWYHRRAVLKQFLGWLHSHCQNHEQRHQIRSSNEEPLSREISTGSIDFSSVVNIMYSDEKGLIGFIQNEIADLSQNTTASSSSNGFQNSSKTSLNINAFDQTKNLKQLNLLYAQRHAKWCQYCFNWTDLMEI